MVIDLPTLDVSVTRNGGGLEPTPDRMVPEALTPYYQGSIRRWRFSVEVGDLPDAAAPPYLAHSSPPRSGGLDSGWRREMFEWRNIGWSDALPQLVETGMARPGWKLLRMDGSGLAGAYSGPLTSNGKEVVMAWAPVIMSFTKVARFAFFGSGATDELGERWALMAVMSALALLEMEARAKGRRLRF